MTLTVTDAERIAAVIGPLRLVRVRARRARHAGAHPRRKAGSGAEFWQYRTLQAGEPADKVDWRRSARADELFVREREREDPVRLWLWTDGSASMDFASAAGLSTKAEAAQTLVSALALAAHEGGETCCLPPGPQPVLPVQVFAGLGRGGGIPVLPDIGVSDIIVAAGDFLDDGSLDWTQTAAAHGAMGIIVAVQDPAETRFDYSGRVRFDAVETDETAHEIGRAEALAGRYAAAWAAHRERLAKAADRAGWLLVELSTGSRLDDVAGRIAAWLRAGS